ncbi:sensor histidine kinase [Paenibacillus sp. FSL R5-0473]|uniref:sensor histidine kinase n=1 Tax=Paenibacillus sp. FSL R5-0473 TaxID=2921642 RepID=UPI0030FCCB34
MKERNRIARHIHDSIGHRLTFIIVQMQALLYVLKNDDETQSSQIVKTVLEVARCCLQEVRSVVHNMGMENTEAGVVSIRSLVNQTVAAIKIHFELNEKAEEQNWPLDISVVLYRCLQEAFTNNNTRNSVTCSRSFLYCYLNRNVVNHIF